MDMELLCRQLVAHGFLSIWHMFAGRAQQTNGLKNLRPSHLTGPSQLIGKDPEAGKD